MIVTPRPFNNELSMKQETITVTLNSGREMQIDLDAVAQYGREAPLFTIPPMPGGNGWPTYRSGKPYCFVKVRPFNEMLIITERSLYDIHAAVERRKQA